MENQTLSSEQNDPAVVKYPVGGPREPVYALMRELGLSRVWGDKHYRSADGIDVHIYGAGSMARILRAGKIIGECKLGELTARLDALRAAS